MVKILLMNILTDLNINIDKQTNFEYDFWPNVKALTGCGWCGCCLFDTFGLPTGVSLHRC